MPQDGAAFAICDVINKKFSLTRQMIDFTLVVLDAIASFWLLGSLVGIREDTLIRVVLIGVFVEMFVKFYRRFRNPKTKEEYIAYKQAKNQSK